MCEQNGFEGDKGLIVRDIFSTIFKGKNSAARSL